MTHSDFDGQSFSGEQPPNRADTAGGPDHPLPADPNPEHPRHYPDEARRTARKVEAGEWDPADLGARKWGLLARWYPHVLPTTGGDPA